MDELTRAIGTMINKYPQKGFTVTELTHVSGLPATALHGILEELVKSNLVRRQSSATGIVYWAIGADPDLVAKKSDEAPRENKGSNLSAGAAAGLITAALAALIAELGS